MPEFCVELPADITAPLEQSILEGEIVQINEDNTYTVRIKKHLVDRVKGFKIEVFSNEHPPPHFRIWHSGDSATFAIDDGSLVAGKGEAAKFFLNVKKWFDKGGREHLIRAWNDTRPTNCPVGPIVSG